MSRCLSRAWRTPRVPARAPPLGLRRIARWPAPRRPHLLLWRIAARVVQNADRRRKLYAASKSAPAPFQRPGAWHRESESRCSANATSCAGRIPGSSGRR